MAKRDAVDVAVDALAETASAMVAFIDGLLPRDLRGTLPEAAIREAFLGDLRSASNSGAEAMRGAVAADISVLLKEWREPLPTGAERHAEAARLLIGDMLAALKLHIETIPLPAPGAPASPWRVKKLEWRKPTDHPQDNEDAALVADGLGGRYAISKPELTKAYGHGGRLLWDADDNFSFTEHRTIADAKAAAQAEFERRIRSAIEPDLPAPPASKNT